MVAPLSARYQSSVLWHDGVDADLDLDYVDGEPPARVDVLVVGSGYCGLEAATELARRGRSVAVVDRGRLGAGGSTRNGGMVLPELKAGPAALERQYGGLGRRMFVAVDEAFTYTESLVTGTGGIDCDYTRTGRLELANGPRGAAALRSAAAELDAIGHGARYVEGAELAAEIGSDHYPAGLVVDRSGGLHPARYHAGLVQRARVAGATLHPHHGVVEVSSGAVRTEGGRVIRARDVFVAVNGYADGAAPAVRDRVLPMGSFVIATEPLTPELQAAVLPTGRMVYDIVNLLSYWRLDAEGRMVYGGRKGLTDTTVETARDMLHQRMVERHPQLAAVSVERAWGGEVAITRDRLPHCGRADGYWYAGGCNGSGVALNTWLGYRMAAAICGEALPPFAELKAPRVPLRSMRKAWLPAVSVALRTQDRLG